jgi:hypothetical protein
MAENKFLVSSKARTELLREKHDHIRQLADKRNEFWTALRSYFAGWNDRLDRIDELYGHKSASLTENEKQNMQLDFTRLKEELSVVRKRCLSSCPDPADFVSDDGSDRLPTPPESLPFGDLRLLHDELQKLQDKLDTIKSKVLPKGKFVFIRYHQAVDLLRAQGKDLSQLESVKMESVSTESRNSLDNAIDLPGSTIRGLDHVSVQVDNLGTIRIWALGALHEPPTLFNLSIDGSVVLRDLSHSTVEL